MSQAMSRGERRREVCMGLTDVGPESGRTTANPTVSFHQKSSGPMLPPRASLKQGQSQSHPRHPALEHTHSGASTPEVSEE